MIRELFASSGGGAELSDIQLFSQLKNLNELKAALQVDASETARRMLGEVDASSRRCSPRRSSGCNSHEEDRDLRRRAPRAPRGYKSRASTSQLSHHADDAGDRGVRRRDVVFMDYAMGDTHGRDARACARRSPAASRGKIVAILRSTTPTRA